MSISHRLHPGLCALTTAFLTVFGASGQDAEPRLPGSTPQPRVRFAPPPDAGRREPELEVPKEVLPAQFQATVYEIQADADRIGTLDGKALAKRGSTPEALLTVLNEVGKARILYRIDQPVNVYSERITVMGSEPMVTGTRTTPSGQSINTITYQNVGVIVRLSAQAPPKEAGPAQPTVVMSLRLAALAPSDTEIAPGRKATTTRSLSLEHSEPLEYNRPLVALAVSSTSAAEQTTPTAYVLRYMFGLPVGK